ncbi:MAG TPA: ribosome maturation factor RimM [Flavobacteriales bacterium]|jgi:16S rRNA processing protein RimM|nr:ribosome maturation factor RimM [Flavobacteriales bacterium]|tara:strand:- start:511 stop:1032 length:522 start_codon:yes stop_codon:yes gene_type:complete
MQKKDCFLVGTVFKLHGYKGDVNIYNEVDVPFDFNTLDYFLIEQNSELIPFFIDRARPTKPNVILVKFEDVDSEEEAKKILKRKIFLPKEFFSETDDNDISKKQLIGFLVIDIKMGELGKITFINSKTAQQLIYVHKDGNEFCFPWHEKFVKNIDAKKGIMEVEIPKEFLDLN